MTDNMTATPKQKHELIVEALGIAGFTENSEYPRVFTQEHGMKKIVKDLNVGGNAYFLVDKKKVTEDDEYNTLAKVDKMITEAEDGRMPSKSEPDEVIHTGAKEAQEQGIYTTDIPAVDIDETGVVILPQDHTVQVTPNALTPAAPSDLTVNTIKKYINDKATDEEAYVFLQLCKARGLNPFLKEAYLIKYDHVNPATMVVGKDAFMKRAETHIEYDGFEAGIIVEYNDSSGFSIVDENRVGTFLREGETLLGGWAKVYRKDHTRPVEITVSMKEFNTGKSSWKKMPATMIRKVALVQALREAFPSELSGMYDSSEMKVEID